MFFNLFAFILLIYSSILMLKLLYLVIDMSSNFKYGEGDRVYWLEQYKNLDIDVVKSGKVKLRFINWYLIKNKIKHQHKLYDNFDDAQKANSFNKRI